MIAIVQFGGWASTGFGPLDAQTSARFAIPSALLLMIGAQTIMAGMFLGILRVDVKR